MWTHQCYYRVLFSGLSLIVPILDINDKLIFNTIKINKNILKYAENVEELILNIEKKLQKKIKILSFKKRKMFILRNHLFNRANEKNLKLFY